MLSQIAHNINKIMLNEK